MPDEGYRGRLLTCVLAASALLFLANPAMAITTWSDPVDVSLPNADMIAGSATVYGGTVYLAVQFVAEPLFGTPNTHNIIWCIDRDAVVETDYVCGGVSGGLQGSDAYVAIWNTPLPSGQIYMAVEGGPTTTLDFATNYAFDAATNTVCVNFPLTLLGDSDDAFNYIVTSTFGGSGGANDWAPDNPTSSSFFTAGRFFSSESVPPQAPCGSQLPTPCPRSHGYWKNHEEAWPVTSLTLGGQTYTQSQLLDLLRAPVKGDASIILAHQLIAAYLNGAAGSDSAPVTAELAAADALLATYGSAMPLGVKPSTADGQQMTAIAGTLDEYNNELLTPGCTSSGSAVNDSAASPSPPGLDGAGVFGVILLVLGLLGVALLVLRSYGTL